jgi:predicted amidohydrolase YtcJ
VYAEQDVRNALENGVDVLTHVGSAGTAPPYSKKLIEDIVNAGRPVVTTGAHRSWVFPVGMSPQRAIMAATRVNARSVLGLPDRGTIESGKLADIIVVNGNPLYDIVALAHVDVVVKDGVVYKGPAPAKAAGRTSSSPQ